nr:hypothetical protein [Tanacetum cinerariifolium]
MILESVENGPILWPTVEENRVTRPKKYSELSATEAIQADCDVKATNIIPRFLRYVDTRPNSEALRKCILSGPYKPTTVLVHVVEATDNSTAVAEHTTLETLANMSAENKAHFLAEKEAIHLILTGIGDDIYLTVDAYQTTQEIWEAIERLQQGESLNIQDVKTNLFWEFGKFTSHDGESMESYYTRFYKLMNEMIKNNLIVTTMQNDQNDVESDDERVALANLKLDVDENKKIQKQLKKANTTLSQELKECKTEFEKYKAFNDRTVNYDKLERKLNEALGQIAHKDNVINEGLKTKAYELSVVKEKHDELMKQNLLTNSHYEGLVKQKTKVITDLKFREEHDIEKLLSMEKQLKLILDEEETLALKRESQSKLNKDSVRPYDYTNLNSLYEIFKPLTQEYETQLAYANEIRRKMWQKSFVKSKPNIYKNVAILPVSKSISKSRQAYNVMTNNINHFKQICDDAWTKHSKDLFRALTTLDIEILIQTCLMPLAIKTQGDSLKFVHELKQEIHVDLKYVESFEKEIDELESENAEFSDMYDVILHDCVSKDVMCSYFQSLSDLDALAELQCMYLYKVKECDCLAQKLSKQTKYVSKKVHTELLQRFAKVEKHLISLEIALQNCKEWAKLQDKNIAISELKKLIEQGKGKSVDAKFDRPSVVRQPNAQRIPKPSVLGKPTPFSNSIERIFFPTTMSVSKYNVSEGLSKPVTAQTLPQIAKKAMSNTNVLKPEMYRIDNRTTHIRAPQLPQTVRHTNPHVSTSTGVNHNTNVSTPQLNSNQSRDKVLPNNSQLKVKKTQVEVHPRIPSVTFHIFRFLRLQLFH